MPVHRLFPGDFNSSDDAAVELLVHNYCITQGKPKEYVEDPIIFVFAAFMNISIVVHHTTVEHPVSINAAAGQDESSVMTLWCNGGHYMVRYRLPEP